MSNIFLKNELGESDNGTQEYQNPFLKLTVFFMEDKKSFIGFSPLKEDPVYVLWKIFKNFYPTNKDHNQPMYKKLSI